jgi:sorting nexin-1/2
MIKNWPGCYIPPIPRKKAIGNNEFVFVENRREGLNDFCKEVAVLKHLWYSS